MELIFPSIHRLVEQSFKLAECPRWDWRTESWLWVDIPSGTLYRYRNNHIEQQSWSEPLGCVAMQGDTGFILAFKSGIYFLETFNAERQCIAPLQSSAPRMRFNDGRATPGSRFMAGTRNGEKQGDKGQFYLLHHDATMEPLPFFAWTCNGLAFSPCGTNVYWADTSESKIYKANYHVQNGIMGESALFADLSEHRGRPDGAAVDNKGGYWVAMYAGSQILRLSPQGRVTHQIAIPATNPTMIAFGGEHYDEMLVTTAADQYADGQVLKLTELGWQGISEPLVDVNDF
ncbi:SMP-30/gluconolactonase/LRE family protein [Thaumasiovibrio subtropicus]|uniref:SMP-30/gluconolactonase/LRE family protein n=1 Tax=Thaumasiovibrio subtropicus TaxID=1891207 RepID=UPI000B353EE1|nr:SMP-30/gluconolactonase/LRE family protein [Thaumasiovibrio subtropicus]